MSLARLQRTLFRMQCDPAWARRLLDGGAAALAAEGLVGRPAAFLLAADPARIVADPEGKRRRQVLSNLSAEFELAARVLAEGPAGLAAPAAFFAAPEFHVAVRDDGPLPAAFGNYVGRRAREAGDALAAAVLKLETALAELRRRPPSPSSPPLAAVDRARGARLSRGARLVPLPCGLLDAYEAAKSAAVDPAAPLRGFFASVDAATPAADDETALVLAAERLSAFRPADVRVEKLEPAVADLLRAAANGLDPASYAREHDLAAEDVAEFVRELVADGVLEAAP